MIRSLTSPASCSHRSRRTGAFAVLAACSALGVAASAAASSPPPPDAELDPGLTVRIHEVAEPLEQLRPVAEGQTPNIDRLVPELDLIRGDFDPATAPFVTEVIGWLRVERPGGFRFRLTSDDGARLTIGGAVIVDHDGRHGPTPRASEPVTLAAGLHRLRIDHFDAGGNRMLQLAWQPPGAVDFAVVPREHLRTDRDPARVTSPGVKRLAGGRRPGDGVPLAGVHPSWRVETIRPEGFEPRVGSMLLLPDGRLLVGTYDPLQRDDRSLPDIDSKPPDAIFAVTGFGGGDRERITVTPVASDLYEPSGMCLLDGELYVAHRRQITRLRDRDGDGFFETHEPVASGWEGWNYHQFVFCLVPGDPGTRTLRAALSTAMAPPAWEGMESNAGPNGPLRGSVIEVEVDSGLVRVLAGGTRTPNGLGRGPDGSLLVSDNQGTWFPTSVLSEVLEGRFFGHYNWTRFVPRLAARFPGGGHPSDWADRPVAPPAVLLPHGEVSNSPTVPLAIPDGPFAGQLLLGELTAGGLRRIMLERVDGQLQGAVFRHTQGLESGVNRMVMADDGSILLGGIGAGGNWNWRETRFGLQRLVPTGETTFEIAEMRATPEGFRVVFTRPVDRAWLADPRNHELRQWRYEPTAAYGGPKLDEQPLRVTEARPSGDGRAVDLSVPGRREGFCVHLRTDPRSVDGEEILSPEAWYTLNRIPRARPAAEQRVVDGLLAGRPRGDGVGVGVLPPPGAAPLITRVGTPLMSFRGRPPVPADNRDQDALIAADPWVGVGMGSGHLLSDVQFGDARIHIEWYSPPGGTGQMAGNSGVYLQDRYEVQVLGTPAGDRPTAIDEAGAIYGVKPADRNASTGPGTWQAYDIWFRAPRFDASGAKLADARMTVVWNGVPVHVDVPVPGPTGAAGRGGEEPAAGLLDAEGRRVQLGPLHLQDHASAAEGPVRYRNAWIAPLDPAAADPGSWSPGPWSRLLESPESAWMVRGGEASLRVDRSDPRGPELVGRTVPQTPNTFFTTVAEYGDFELTWEVKVDPWLNSGVQIRSDLIGGPEDRGGGLAGLQVEIDPSDRGWTGGIYEERGRGWLHPLSDAPAARRAFRPTQWNRIRVVATGPLVRTWINGVPAATLFDAVRLRGHIGFQVHGVGELAEPLEVRFRDIRLRPLQPAGGG